MEHGNSGNGNGLEEISSSGKVKLMEHIWEEIQMEQLISLQEERHGKYGQKMLEGIIILGDLVMELIWEDLLMELLIWPHMLSFMRSGLIDCLYICLFIN